MSFSNLNCEKKNGLDENKSLSKDYLNEKLEGNNQIQIHGASNPSNQITVASLINQAQIQNRQIDVADITNESQKGESISTPRKSLRNALIERRLRSRKKSKILKNPRQIPLRRKAVRNLKTKVEKKKNSSEDKGKGGRKTIKERVCVERSEEIPKRGKRGLVGGKAKANPPKEDSNNSHDSDEDADSFHFYRISLGFFQKFRDVQGASTSTRPETPLDKTSPSFTNRKLEAKNSEERELSELQRWGTASLLTSDNIMVETDKLGVNTNSSGNFERDETNSGESCDFTVKNSLYQDLIKPLADVRKVERGTELRSSTVKLKICPNPESLCIGDVNYKWIQTPDSISVEIKCPLVVSSDQVSVKITPVSLEINIKSSNESEWTPFFNCNFAGRISAEESTWCLGPFPSILVYLKKLTKDFWESFTRPPAESPDNVVDGSQTDLDDETYQPAVLDIIKNLSLIEINKTCTKEPINSYKNKSEGRTSELRNVMESGEECNEVEKFD